MALYNAQCWNRFDQVKDVYKFPSLVLLIPRNGASLYLWEALFCGDQGGFGKMFDRASLFMVGSRVGGIWPS